MRHYLANPNEIDVLTPGPNQAHQFSKKNKVIRTFLWKAIPFTKKQHKLPPLQFDKNST